MGSNAVLLSGTIVEPPYFELLGATGIPFLRFYLAVPRLHRKGEDHIRVVAYGKLAQDAYTRLSPGAGVALVGHLQSRLVAAGSWLALEVVAERLMEAGRSFINKVLLVGTVTSPPWFGFGGVHTLRIFLAVPRPPVPDIDREQGDDHIRVVAYDQLARETYAYLRPGAKVAVDGYLQVRPSVARFRIGDGPRSVMEVVASELTLIADVDWETGDRVLAQLRQLEEQAGAR